MTRARRLGFLLAWLALIPLSLWADPAPPAPTVDNPLYDCSSRVYLRSFDSGATLRVYVNNAVKGTRTGATGSGAWVSLDDPLQGGDEVRVTQEVGGMESAPAAAAPVFVAAPDPAPLIHFELPLVRCAKGSYVHNAMAGGIAIDSSAGDRLAQESDNEGDFPTYLARQLTAGERLAATVDHCRLGALHSADTPVSNLYRERGELPVPLIDPGTAIECQQQVLVGDLLPGATAVVRDGSTPLGDQTSTSDATWVRLSSPMIPSWSMEARQWLCASSNLSDASPQVQPAPLSALEAPVLEGPIWATQSHVYVRSRVPVDMTITVAGTPVRSLPVDGRIKVNLENPLVAGQEVTAFYALCGQTSPPAKEAVIEPPRSLPPPEVAFPLFACTNRVAVSQLLDQAEVVVLIDGKEVHRDATTSDSAEVTIGPMLQAGQSVTAYQLVGATRSGESTPVIVFAAPDLDPPKIQAPLVACQREVVVGDVLPHAFVTLYVNGPASPLASEYAGLSTAKVQTPPLKAGWQVQARQQLNTCQESGLSEAVTVDPFDPEVLAKAPSIVEPIVACQTRFVVRDLTPNTELDVYIDNAFVKRASVSGEARVVSIQPPLRDGQKIRVTPVACGKEGSRSASATVQPPQPLSPPPDLREPVFNGDTYVLVSDVPSSALILILNAAGNQVGAGMGSTPVSKISLWQPASTGDVLTATAFLCGRDVGSSAPVVVQPNRAPLPHEAMVSYFWLDAAGNAQAVLHISGRNLYQASTIGIDGITYPTFHTVQLTPDFGRNATTLGTPIDTIGKVVMLLFQDSSGVRFSGGQQLQVSIDGPAGSSSPLLHYSRTAGAYTNRYDLAVNMVGLDSDGDGLTDLEEEPGATVDLAALGANPLRLDVFAEVDWMVLRKANGSVDHTHEPHPDSFSRVSKAFSQAWSINADGSRGIHLYVDYGQNGGSGGDELPHSNTIAFDATDTPDVLYRQFYNNNFEKKRQGLFHYAVFGHQQPGTTSSGVAYLRSDQLIVTLINSGKVNDSGWITKVAGTFIHELGHNLNLEHGGDTPTNRKPNYPSVMNYSYQFPGISTDCDLSADGVYSYSYGTLADLDETSLDEPDGICDGVAQNWNGNLSNADTGIQVNINTDNVSDYTSSPAALNQALFNEYVNPVTAISPQPLHDYCGWCYRTLEEVK